MVGGVYHASIIWLAIWAHFSDDTEEDLTNSLIIFFSDDTDTFECQSYILTSTKLEEICSLRKSDDTGIKEQQTVLMRVFHSVCSGSRSLWIELEGTSVSRCHQLCPPPPLITWLFGCSNCFSTCFNFAQFFSLNSWWVSWCDPGWWRYQLNLDVNRKNIGGEERLKQACKPQSYAGIETLHFTPVINSLITGVKWRL